MSTIMFMVSIALLLSLGFVLAYLWALSQGQFDDLETPVHRILKNDCNINKDIKNNKGNLNEK